MLLVFVLMLVVISLGVIMVLINNFVSMKTFMDREKLSPFECGYDPKSASRLPFSLHFFLIAVIFLVFDVEIILLLPMILTVKASSAVSAFGLFVAFIMVLLLGVYHEWSQGMLDWSS